MKSIFFIALFMTSFSYSEDFKKAEMPRPQDGIQGFDSMSEEEKKEILKKVLKYQSQRKEEVKMLDSILNDEE